VQQHRLQGNVVQQTNHSLITTRTPPGKQGRRTEHTSTKTQATDHPNTEQPTRRRTQVQPGTPRDDEPINSTKKKPKEYIRQKPLT